MRTTTGGRAGRIAGFVLHVLIGGLMIFAGFGKVTGNAPPPVVEAMGKFGLGGQMRLIGAGETIAAVLMLVPVTSSLGVLLVSGFWGGVICIHMAHGESYAPYAVFLLLTWLGAYLRNPLTFSSFFARPGAEPRPI